MKERVEWLVKMFPDVDVRWSTTVEEFLAGLQKAEKPPALIILDHDLGPGSVVSEDAKGLTGTDAARQLRVKCPVLIWSWNTWGANRMSAYLGDNGIVHRAIPMTETNYTTIAAFVANCLRSHEENSDAG